MSLSKEEIGDLRKKGKRLCYRIDAGKKTASDWIRQLKQPFRRRAMVHLNKLSGSYSSLEEVVGLIRQADPINFNFWNSSINIAVFKNKDLYSLYSRLSQLEQTDEVKEGVAEINKINEVQYKTLCNELNDLQLEFFVMNEDNTIKTETTESGTTSVFNPGKTFEDYQKRLNEIMDKEIIIKI